MRVKDLIAMLQKMPPDKRVVMQIDSEGNGYNLLYGLDDEDRYFLESEGAVYTKEDVDYLYEDGEAARNKLEKVIVLYP